MDSSIFERYFVALVCEKGARQYGSLMAFAKAIWPDKDEKTASQTIYAIQRKSNKTGKPQRLKLDEAFRMVELLDGYNGRFPSFCFEVCELVKAGALDIDLILQDQNDEGPLEKNKNAQIVARSRA